MKYLRIAVLLLLLNLPGHSFAVDACHGQFPNLITDVCWDCAFPIKLFGLPMMSSDPQEDYDTGVPNLCACTGPLGVPVSGFHTSFWEFTRQVDVTRTPYCMVSLGTKMDLGINDQMVGDETPGTFTAGGRVDHTVFRQVHWYINPLMGLLQILLDSKCLEQQPFDIAYMSEIDPTHSDEELARIIAPESYMFGNIVTNLACSVDCVQSSIGFGSNLLYWCSGCNGEIYPMTGFVPHVYGGVQMSSVLVHRITAKMHRMMTQYSTTGPDGMCGNGQIQITMDKRQYKYTMLYPVSQSSGDTVASYSGTSTDVNSNPASTSTQNSTEAAQVQSSGYGRCCQPYGRTTILWGAGRELPVPEMQDFAYGIFRKRDCCQ